ncbi:MAG: NUDIX hydrolase [Desulfobacterales bacterium]
MAHWKLLLSEPVLVTPWITVHKNRYKIEGDEYIDDYYIVKRNDFALIVATYQEKLLLVKQYRPATNKDYLALPAGFLKEGESPIECAKRELLEETGFSAENSKLIGELHPLPGYIQSNAYIVTCNALPVDNSERDMLEISEVHLMSWADILNKIVLGKINEMQAVSAILLAKEFDSSKRKVT